MNASKEEARIAGQQIERTLTFFDDISGKKLTSEDVTSVKKALVAIREFVEAAQRKLPSEAAYAKDKERRKAS